MVPREGFKPPTPTSVVLCSIQLSQRGLFLSPSLKRIEVIYPIYYYLLLFFTNIDAKHFISIELIGGVWFIPYRFLNNIVRSFVVPKRLELLPRESKSLVLTITPGDWLFRAGSETRTHDLDLGKVAH